MSISQKSQPAAAFHPCCGRRTQLSHAATCPTQTPAADIEPPIVVEARGPLTIKRVGARVTCTRSSGTTVIRFRIASAAKQCEARLRQPDGHEKLDEIVAQMQAGLWS